jgi:hypothetical protein
MTEQGTVLFYSMEVTARALVAWRFSQRPPEVDAEFIQRIRIDDSPITSVIDAAYAAQATPDCKLIIFDSALRMLLPQSGRDRREREWALAMDLKELARTFDVPVVVTMIGEWQSAIPESSLDGEPVLPRGGVHTVRPRWPWGEEADAVWAVWTESAMRPGDSNKIWLKIQDRDRGEGDWCVSSVGIELHETEEDREQNTFNAQARAPEAEGSP